jgi:hypothetical protein
VGRFAALLPTRRAHPRILRAALTAPPLAGALALALRTAAGALAALVALAPAALRGGPRGRSVASPRPEDAARTPAPVAAGR